MEQYTEKHYDGNGYYLICSGNCEALNCGDCGILDKIVDRLAAYEDTGLEPEEVKQIKKAAAHMMFEDVAHFVRYALSNFDELQKHKELGDYNRLRELDQADREGRCVVLPAKPDQTIYQWRKGDDCPSVSRLDGVQIILKAADVAPVRHGRWISWEEAGNPVPSPDRHECSVCHDAAQVLVNGFELLSDYCPNCGVKMD